MLAWGLLLGVGVGIISGIVGIGGGIFIVPVLVYLFHYSQHRAQGTSLAALLLPIGIFAFWKYYQAGNADLKMGALIAVGFAVGGYFGGMWAQAMPDLLLKRIFATLLALISVRMFFGK